MVRRVIQDVLLGRGPEDFVGAHATKNKKSKGKGKKSDTPDINVFKGAWGGGVQAASEIAKNLSEARATWNNSNAYTEELRLNGEAFRHAVPTIETFAQGMTQYLKHKQWMDLFQVFLMTGSMLPCFLVALQGPPAEEVIGVKISEGLEALVGLDAPRKFAAHIIHYINKEVATTYYGNEQHFYFLYHPDTDWHAEFYGQVDHGGHSAVPVNLLGMSENLPALCNWMRFLRRELIKSVRKARFHLIIPSYRPLVIKTEFIFHKDLFPLTIHGEIHNSKELVWLNLPTLKDASPEDHDFTLMHVGNIAMQPKSKGQLELVWDGIRGLFSTPEKPEPVVLGGPEAPEDGAANEVAEQARDDDFVLQERTRHVSHRRSGHRDHAHDRRGDHRQHGEHRTRRSSGRQ